jgi:hypothetical protein
MPKYQYLNIHLYNKYDMYAKIYRTSKLEICHEEI